MGTPHSRELGFPVPRKGWNWNLEEEVTGSAAEVEQPTDGCTTNENSGAAREAFLARRALRGVERLVESNPNPTPAFDEIDLRNLNAEWLDANAQNDFFYRPPGKPHIRSRDGKEDARRGKRARGGRPQTRGEVK